MHKSTDLNSTYLYNILIIITIIIIIAFFCQNNILSTDYPIRVIIILVFLLKYKNWFNPPK